MERKKEKENIEQKKSATNQKAPENSGLQERVRELENQLAVYKNRLELLRKAKSTTLVKHEREFVEVKGLTAASQRPGKSSVDVSELEDGIRAMEMEHSLEIEQLKKRHAAEIQQMKDVLGSSCCDHLELIEALQRQLAESETMQAVLTLDRDELQEEISNLLMQLSEKEANWCDSEEKQMNMLIVNVKNKGGDVIQEVIDSNTTSDIVIVNFRRSDGTLVTQLIDFINEVQIFKAVILPEEELGLDVIQTFCFVVRLVKNEFISSDAMSKLRQKNPNAIRHPEEDKGRDYVETHLVIDLSQSAIISPYIAQQCADASEFIYVKDDDLRAIAQSLNKDYLNLASATRPVSSITQLQQCQNISELHTSRPCLCHYEICVGWYPCGLKYCKDKDGANKVTSYRCGIKTCSKCRMFEFYVPQRHQCSWDLADSLSSRLQAASEGSVYATASYAAAHPEL